MSKLKKIAQYPDAVSCLYCFLTAAVLLALFSHSSFLYEWNQWPDVNIYMTFGREILRGEVPYRDLFDHKGLLLYLIFAAVNMISSKTFLGLYLLEVLSFGIFLFYSCKLLRLFCGPVYSIACVPIIGCLVAISQAFSLGGSVEELNLSFTAAGLYFLTCLIREEGAPYRHLFRTVLINGILAGCVMWIKYSLLGFWFAWMMFVFFLLVSKSEWKRGLLCCVLFLSGMAVSSVPCLIYLAATGSFSDFWEVYILFNLRYAGNTGAGLLSHLRNGLHYFIELYGHNKILGTLCLSGIGLLTVFPVITKSLAKRLILPCVFLFSIALEFWGSISYFYYFLTVAPFLVTFFAAAGVGMDWIWKRFRLPVKTGAPAMTAGWACLLLCSCIYGCMREPDMDGMNRSLEESSQYQVASYLDEKKEPVTLMYYNTLDTGALMFSDYARPWGKYYFMPNISHKNFPDLLDTQEAGIRNREADYVLSYRVFPEVLHKYYRLVQYFPQDMETNTGAYYLMEANPYVLCGDCTLEFHDDSSLANVSGELEWVMQGDEAAIELIGTLPQPIKAAHISLIVPPEVSPDIFLLVSADGENWFQPPSQLDDQEISIELNAMEIQYIKLVRDRNLGIHSLWKLWVYKTEEN